MVKVNLGNTNTHVNFPALMILQTGRTKTSYEEIFYHVNQLLFKYCTDYPESKRKLGSKLWCTDSEKALYKTVETFQETDGVNKVKRCYFHLQFG